MSGMGTGSSRRSQRIARRQEAARVQEQQDEDSDPDFSMPDDDVDEEEMEQAEYDVAGESSSDEDEDAQNSHALQHFLMRLSGMTTTMGYRSRSQHLRKVLQKFGEIPENPPHMVNELSHSLHRATRAEEITPPEDCGPAPGTNCAGASVTNSALMMWSRTAGLNGRHKSWGPAQCRHLAAFHFLPNRPLALRDSMNSRAYIGQYSHQGDLFVGGFQADKRVRIYDTENNWKLKKDVHARNLRWTITDTTLSSDQRFLIYSSITPTLNMVNVDVGGVDSEANVTEIHEALHLDEMEGVPEGSNRHYHFGIFGVNWSADSQHIVAGTGNSHVLIFNMEKRKTVTRLTGHSDDVNAVAYLDESSNVIASGSDDSLIKAWDLRARQSAVGVFVGHTQGITHLDPKGDGRYLLSNSKDQTAKIWDMRKIMEQSQYRKMPRPELPEFGWDYRLEEYPGRKYNIRHPHDCSVQTLRGHSVFTTLIRAYWSPAHTTGQRYVYTASADGAIYIYDVISSKLVNKLSYHKCENSREIIRDVSWHPYQPSIVTAAFDGSLIEWGYSGESQEYHLKRLPDTGYDTSEDRW